MTDKLAWLFSSLAFVLVLEGLMPFAMPNFWRKTLTLMLIMPEKSLRTYGLVLMLLGTLIIYFIHI